MGELKLKTRPVLFLVEDNVAYKILVARMLEQEGFWVVMLNDGNHAINMFKHIKPDIILSDIEMPGLDGFSMKEKMEELYPNLQVPLVYFSSSQEKKIIEKANILGNEKCIQKPVYQKHLSNTLLSVLNK